MKIVNRTLLAGLLSIIAAVAPAWAATPAVAAGSHHSLLLKSDGTLWGWGDNYAGNVGDGTGIARTSPVKVSLNIPATAIAVGPLSSFATGSDGFLYAWGDNTQYELGLNTTYNQLLWPTKSRAAPVSITSGGNLFSVEALVDGSVYSFGLNLFGELGQGTISTNTTPNPNSGGVVPSLSNITVVSSGSCHTLALRSDGTVWAWGCNSSGQLGDGTTIDRESPAQISGLSNVVAIAAGGLYSIAIRNDGTVWTWGYNFGLAQANTPTQLPGLISAKAAATGGDGATSAHALILKTDGTVWAWGNDSVGDGTRTARSTPVQVLSGVISIGAGTYHSLAIKSDGSVWAWGTNTSGELGLGLQPNSIRTIPTKIQQFYAIPPLPPANDNFVNRTTITGSSGSISGTLAGATREAGEPLEGGVSSNSIWYKWVAPATGQVTLSTVGGPSSSVAAYTGTAVNSLKQASNGTLPFFANAGTEYEIVVYDTANDQYDTTLNWNLNSSASADISVSGSGSMSGTTPGLAYYNC